ncbi:MAG: tetraacyldisaccharide 4'-kinase [Candidatus Omnitrophota bacterium]
MRKYIYSLITDNKKGVAAGLIKAALFFLSLIYYFAVRLIKFLYFSNILKSFRPLCKVISVGNITLGGTGKTPLVLEIAARLRDSGKKVVVLSRGYKTQKLTKSSDEVELFRRRLPDVPILADRDRIKTAKLAVSRHKADLVLLDDGFQHWRLKRDLDIVTMDLNNPFGNKRLIPRGILREPVVSLRRADIFVLTKVGCDGDSMAKAEALKSRLCGIKKDAQVFTARYTASTLFDPIAGELVQLSELNGRKIALLCGIGDPESFEETVKSLGACVILRFYFMDHHSYSGRDIETVICRCRDRDVDTIVTTEKDAARLEAEGYSERSDKFSGIKLLVLGINMEIYEEERFFDRIYSLLNS